VGSVSWNNIAAGVDRRRSAYGRRDWRDGLLRVFGVEARRRLRGVRESCETDAVRQQRTAEDNVDKRGHVDEARQQPFTDQVQTGLRSAVELHSSSCHADDQSRSIRIRHNKQRRIQELLVGDDPSFHSPPHCPFPAAKRPLKFSNGSPRRAL